MAENEQYNYQNTRSANTPWNVLDVIYTYGIVIAVTLLAVGVLLFSNIDSTSVLLPVLLQVIISLSVLVAIYLIVNRKYHVSVTQAMGISTEKFTEHFVTGLFVSLLLVLSTTIVSIMFSYFGEIPKDGPYTNLPVEKLRIISILAVFLAPAVEEIFFRGFMQPALIKALGLTGGVLSTAIIFGLSHAQYHNYSIALVAVTIIGLILGITREKTQSVVPGIIAHLMNNLYAALSLF